MGITRSPLPQNIGNLPFPFLVVTTQFFSWIIFINSCICIYRFTWIIVFMIVYVIQKIGCNDNSPKFSQRNSKLPLLWQKKGNYPVIPLYGF